MMRLLVTQGARPLHLAAPQAPHTQHTPGESHHHFPPGLPLFREPSLPYSNVVHLNLKPETLNIILGLWLPHVPPTCLLSPSSTQVLGYLPKRQI